MISIEPSANVEATAETVNSVTIEDIIHQASLHAASSGFVTVKSPAQAAALFNAADDVGMQRIQSQLERVTPTTKRYWVH